MRVLAVGATGQYAGLVVPALVSAGQTVRALVHDPSKAAGVEAAGAQETVPGDLTDPSSLASALDGVDGVFHITPAFADQHGELGVGMVEAAQAAGVRRFVFSGVYHPSLSLVNHATTRPVEEAVFRSSMEFTVLQPAMYLQGLSSALSQARDSGAIVMPYSKDSAMTFVDFRDVAEVAAMAFATDHLVGGVFELAAPGPWTRTQIAALATRFAGREITAQDLAAEKAVGDLPPGAMRDGLTAMFADYTSHGFHGGNDLVLRTLLERRGREPRTMEAYVAETLA